MPTPTYLIGGWDLEAMDMWDSDAINLVEQGHITFTEHGGQTVFGRRCPATCLRGRRISVPAPEFAVFFGSRFDATHALRRRGYPDRIQVHDARPQDAPPVLRPSG